MRRARLLLLLLVAGLPLGGGAGSPRVLAAEPAATTPAVTAVIALPATTVTEGPVAPGDSTPDRPAAGGPHLPPTGSSPTARGPEAPPADSTAGHALTTRSPAPAFPQAPDRSAIPDSPATTAAPSTPVTDGHGAMLAPAPTAVPATAAVVAPGPFAIDNPRRLLVIFFASVLTNNIALAYFIGMCAFLALSKNTKVAFGMGAAVTFVTGLTAVANWLLNHFVLVPLGLESFQFLVFILTIATIVQFLELFIDRYFPPLYEAFGIFLPLITVNCTVLGTSLFMVLRQYRFWEAAVFSFATGLGWMLAILLLAGLRHHLPFCRPPRHLGEIGAALLLAGLMAMAFNGFSGMVKL